MPHDGLLGGSLTALTAATVQTSSVVVAVSVATSGATPSSLSGDLRIVLGGLVATIAVAGVAAILALVRMRA